MGATKRSRGAANGAAKGVSNGAAKGVSNGAAKGVSNGAAKTVTVENAADQPGKFFDPMAVTWMEKYNAPMEKIWSRLPSFVRSTIVTLAVFILGATMRGEWLLTAVHTARYLGWELGDGSEGWDFSWQNLSLEALRLKNLRVYWLVASFVSYFMYFSIGGFLHWYFYVRQRDRPEEWKCQPTKFLPPELERHEILVGSFSLLITSSFTATLACYISNGGWSRVYYEFDEYGWTWWFLQWAVIFIYQDYATYWLHRIYHTPFLYKHFHKLHHKYKQPTAFSVTAIHPVEIMHIQITLCLPLFVIPCHFVPFCGVALYTYYHGIIDHSGINFKAYWWQPWQPDAIFHDNHHQYFHVNFAFNIYIWDKLHGTYRQKDRLYTEDTFYGRGKALSEATEEERQQDLTERLSENPRAYRSGTLEYKLEGAETATRKRAAAH
ncbi:lathosterol oxidase-like [Schistocerca cancellata]|uniref:lathosterol oxidase-like n=1 Tax=Schistocerca cancellata TaxID=274614 RepID=UPI00211880E0|nr:lathosterol oxidase-like [Schistocerca cancellata]